jgi:hypothetical protein
MVDARSRIQPELIRLLEFQRAYRANLQVSAFLRVVGLLASAGFSLWRAAFLFHREDGQHEQYLDNVETFLSKIITDNTIAFADDRNTWSLWHYIGVARSSLVDAITLLGSGKWESPKMNSIRVKLADPPLLKGNAAEQWNELFEVMQLVRETAIARIETIKSLPKIQY